MGILRLGILRLGVVSLVTMLAKITIPVYKLVVDVHSSQRIFVSNQKGSPLSTRKPFATHFPPLLNLSRRIKSVVAETCAVSALLGSEDFWQCISLAKGICFHYILFLFLSQPWSPSLLGQQRQPGNNTEVENKPCRCALSPHLVSWLHYQCNNNTWVGLRTVTYFDCLT